MWPFLVALFGKVEEEALGGGASVEEVGLRGQGLRLPDPLRHEQVASGSHPHTESTSHPTPFTDQTLKVWSE